MQKMRVSDSRGDYLQRRTGACLLLVFAICVLSGMITGCVTFVDAPTMTEEGKVTGGGEKLNSLLKMVNAGMREYASRYDTADSVLCIVTLHPLGNYMTTMEGRVRIRDDVYGWYRITGCAFAEEVVKEAAMTILVDERGNGLLDKCETSVYSWWEKKWAELNVGGFRSVKDKDWGNNSRQKGTSSNNDNE